MFKVKEIKMSVGDRVVMIENHELRRGVIRKIYDDIPTPVLMVEFDDGEIEKVYPGDVAIEPKAEVKEDQEVKEEKKPIEKSEITITPDEFMEIASNVVAKEAVQGGAMLMMLGTILMTKLHEKLFVEEKEND